MLDADPEESGARLADRAKQFEALARELRLIAGAIADRRDTVQPTALVNEAYLKLSNCPTCSWKDAAHFLRVAAVTMRSILLDHKRARKARKRGGEISHEPLDEAVHYLEESCGAQVEDVHRAVSALAAEDPEVAEYVNLRFFAGRTNVEAAAALGISERTGVRYWEFARPWLHRYLSK
jgi:RNA polymerase sigma factor (TIGR02999 family)